MWKAVLAAAALVLLCKVMHVSDQDVDDPDRAYCEVCASWKTCQGTDRECPWRGKWEEKNKES